MDRYGSRTPEERDAEFKARVRRVVRWVGLSVVVFFTLLTLSCSVSCVNTGQVGVVTRFGKVTGRTMTEGINFVNPLYGVHEMSVRTQELKEVAETPSEEGLIFSLEVSLLYHLVPDKAGTVYQGIGADYQTTLIEPTFRSAIRAVTSAHKSADLYSTARDSVQTEIFKQTSEPLLARGIVVEKVLLRDLKLPATLKASIEGKQQMEQEAEKMKFTLQRETQEAERKRVEARGIKDFQQIVSEGISDKLLEWKGIEATIDLAKSPNAKVIVIGAGKGGLPIILNPGGDNK
jgi:regulator of protease activity HflC (stomatin/prohibitin superfamily)